MSTARLLLPYIPERLAHIASRPPLCGDCGERPRRLRENNHTMSLDGKMSADPYHHLCGPCYLRRLLARGPVKATTGKTAHVCHGCRIPIPKGNAYAALWRAGGPGGRRERVRVCLSCAGPEHALNPRKPGPETHGPDLK